MTPQEYLEDQLDLMGVVEEDKEFFRDKFRVVRCSCVAPNCRGWDLEEK